MSAELIPFDFEEQAVRVFVLDGEPWFVAADVCRVLGIVNPSDAIVRLDEDEVTTVNLNTLGSTEGIRGNPNARAVSESGLYALIFTSRKPEARAFRKWVTGTVLPTLRRTGGFTLDPAAAPAMPLPAGSDMVTGIDTCTAADVQTWLDLIRETRRLGGRSAGLRLWAQSPLPPIDGGSAAAAQLDPEEGRECLAHLLTVMHGNLSIGDAIADRADDVLSPLGLRVVGADLFVGNGDTPGTRLIFGGTRWALGGHRVPLLALPGARPDATSRTLANRRLRGVLVPLSL